MCSHRPSLTFSVATILQGCMVPLCQTIFFCCFQPRVQL
jgi:hypothetical protein